MPLNFEVSADLLSAVQRYIDEHYVDEHTVARRKPLDVEELTVGAAYGYSAPAPHFAPSMAAPPSLKDIVGSLDEPFSATLLRLIDAKGRTDAEVYKRANIDRRLFSKLRSKDYRPGKKTVVALCVALELTLDEAENLLKRAGFALSRSAKSDVIVEYFITSGRYDIFEINNVLFEYDQPILGG
jgi:hypothetical protein